MVVSRREILLAGLGVAASTALPAEGATPARRHPDTADCMARESQPQWVAGIEGQRRADLGNGFYRNPILAGDHPDPTVLKDGAVYYQVSSSFHYYPGLVVWQSHDLVNWQPVGPALRKPVGSVFAPDLVKHEGRYYIYFPGIRSGEPDNVRVAPDTPKSAPLTTYVVHAEKISGPWSDPVDMGIYDGIDPGHVVGEDGKRYLFMSGGALVPISDDGLHRAGPTETVYKGWDIPADWVTEGVNLEGPKPLHRDGWIYLFAAEGGTAGPPTSHMLVVARSRSVRGPWENCPHNPIVRTTSVNEPWWSRGHATPVEGPHGDWWLVYHGYENGFRTLGRQMLLDPLEWSAEGWPVAKGGVLAKPLRKPAGGRPDSHGVRFSGDFSAASLGARAAFFMPRPDYMSRAQFEDGALVLSAQGSGPANTSPLVFDVGDRSYELSVEVELRGSAQGGLLLFYDEKLFCGLASDPERFHSYNAGEHDSYSPVVPAIGSHLFLRLVNLDNVVSFYSSRDGKSWAKQVSFEVSGYNHNVAQGFLSLRPALFASGEGGVSYRSVTYSGRVSPT